MLSKMSLVGLSAVAASKSDHWAVLVAGSNTYGNYRHQADTCHAYQILKANGIPESQIIHLAYDDIANNSRNPFPGKIFNKPTAKGVEGVDVYEGCNIDYRGSETTAKNLIAVLEGDKSAAKGPVLESNENSRVFFYFADHGAPGLVAMPTGGYLYADQLHTAVKTMAKNKMFKEMTMYVEACESGSMFENILEDNLGVYAVSAANSHESSWGAYCSPNDAVNGVHVGSCLGDLFSINWMEDSDKAVMNDETLQTQFDTVQKETTRSHVLQWGQKTFTSEPIGDFQSGEVDMKVKEAFNWKKMGFKLYKDLTSNFSDSDRKNMFAVDSRDTKLHDAYAAVMREPTPEHHQALEDEIQHRMKVDKTFEEIFPHHMQAVKGKTTPNPTDFECYREMVNAFEDKCFDFSEYSMKYMGALVAQCEHVISAYPEAKEMTLNKMAEVCKK